MVSQRAYIITAAWKQACWPRRDSRESRSTENGDAADAYDESMRSILLAMMKSFSCSPLIFLVLNETVA